MSLLKPFKHFAYFQNTLALALTIGLFISFPPYTIATESTALKLTEIADNLYMHSGKIRSFRDPKHEDIANIGFIVGKKCVAIIDTGGSISVGKRLRQALRKITQIPICYVINTHGHFDHVLGNYAFKNDNPKFIGHKALREAINNNRQFFLESFSTSLGTNAKPNWIIGPSIIVNKTLTLDLGERKLNLRAHGTAHTNNDLSVYDIKTKTLWVSDLLFIKHIPVINGSINGWIDQTEDLLNSDAEQIVAGHGPLTENWKSAVKAQTKYLKELRSEIRDIQKNGGIIETAIETVGRTQSERWLLYNEYHKRNVSRAFAELEWE